MPLYTWSCSGCGHEFDALGGREQRQRPCLQCGDASSRKQVYAPTLHTSEPIYAGKDFIEASAQMEDRISRMEEKEGTQIARPHFFKEAMKEAARMQKAGVKSSKELRKLRLR